MHATPFAGQGLVSFHFIPLRCRVYVGPSEVVACIYRLAGLLSAFHICNIVLQW